MSNKVFYQHPNLMRALGMHETVMEVMVNVLGGGDSKVLVFIHLISKLKRDFALTCQWVIDKVNNKTNIMPS